MYRLWLGVKKVCRERGSMKILYCGTMLPEEIEYQVKDISAAGNRFQNNMIKNMKRAGYQVVSCSFFGMGIPKKLLKGWSRNYILKDHGLLKGSWDFHRLLERTMSDTDVVMCYNIAYAWLFLPLIAKRKRKRSIAVVADYSESVSYKSLPGKLYAKLQLWSMRRFDTVIGLSGKIKDKLRKKQKFILMEGGIDEELYNAFAYRPHEEGAPITFMYSGLLNHVTGVNLLLDAMKRVERQDIRLWISGKGEMEEAVKAAAEEDDRICYLGHLPYEEYIQKLQEADVLVNPRDMSLPENQNNFPSKIMDYLAAGKVIISTKFAGWKRFEENILFCGNSVEEIRKGMEEAIKRLSDDRTIFYANREKVKKFEWEMQLKRIFEEM